MKRFVYLFLSLLLTFLLTNHFYLSPSNAETEVPDSIFTQEDPTEGSSQYYLNIAGIEGESTDAGREGLIEVLSYGWGETSELPTGGGALKLNFEDFHIKARVSKASPKLLEAAVSGQPISEVIFTAYRTDQTGQIFPYINITMNEVIVVSHQQAGVNESIPMDNYSLNFGKIKYEYAPNKDATESPVTYEYDLKKNQKS
jgi:type VI secretion system secreted protein Hcp